MENVILTAVQKKSDLQFFSIQRVLPIYDKVKILYKKCRRFLIYVYGAICYDTK